MPACRAAGVEKSKSSLLTTVLLFALAAVGGCASTHGKLAKSAERLQHNANVLGRDSLDSNYGSDPQGYARDAQTLSQDTHRFRETLAEGNPDKPEVKAAFERVSQSYQTLRDAIEQSNSHEAQKDLKPITEAYLDVEHKIGG
jgi:hypothetical protein